MDKMQYGDYLKQAIKEEGWTYYTLEEKTGIMHNTISHYVNNRREPDYKNMKAIAKALKRPIGYFFGESIEPNQTATDGRTDYIKIPLFESKAAATPGVLDVARDEQKGELVIGCAEMEHKGTLHAFNVRGKSMYPILDDGDTVVIQANGITTAADINRHDIYICEIDDGFGTHGLTLKRVKVDRKGLILFSINPEFEPLYVEMPKGKMLKDVIKGRVVRVVRNL